MNDTNKIQDSVNTVAESTFREIDCLFNGLGGKIYLEDYWRHGDEILWRFVESRDYQKK